MSDIFEERQAFNFYKSYYKTSLLLDTENRAEFLDCILHYQFTGEFKEPNLPFASLAFNGQIHSLQKQVNGFIKGKKTYPSGNPTKGTHKANYKGNGKEVQEEDKEEVKLNKDIFIEIKNFKSYHLEFKGNKSYLLVAYKFWELWKKDNPENQTIKKAMVYKWIDTIRLIVEVDKQKIERLIAIYKYFEKCQEENATYDNFWFKTIRSIGGLRVTNKQGAYRLDTIMEIVNTKMQKDEAFNRLVTDSIENFKKY